MQNVDFENVRFDPDLTPFHNLAKQMAKAFGYTAELSIEKELAQLLRLRVAQLNACSYCLILHTRMSREIGIHSAKIDQLGSWWNSQLFTDKEKALLRYCDVLTEGVDLNFQQYHDALSPYFSEVEIAEIAAIVINMNVWTRLKLAQGAVPVWKADN